MSLCQFSSVELGCAVQSLGCEVNCRDSAQKRQTGSSLQTCDEDMRVIAPSRVRQNSAATQREKRWAMNRKSGIQIARRPRRHQTSRFPVGKIYSSVVSSYSRTFPRVRDQMPSRCHGNLRCRLELLDSRSIYWSAIESGLAFGIAKHLQKDRLREPVQFQRARAWPQRVRLVQDRRDPPLLVERRQGNFALCSMTQFDILMVTLPMPEL